MAKKEGSSIQIFDMNHGYNIDEWRENLSDMRLLLGKTDINLNKNKTNKDGKPVDSPPEATNL